MSLLPGIITAFINHSLVTDLINPAIELVENQLLVNKEVDPDFAANFVNDKTKTAFKKIAEEVTKYLPENVSRDEESDDLRRRKEKLIQQKSQLKSYVDASTCTSHCCRENSEESHEPSLPAGTVQVRRTSQMMEASTSTILSEEFNNPEDLLKSFLEFLKSRKSPSDKIIQDLSSGQAQELGNNNEDVATQSGGVCGQEINATGENPQNNESSNVFASQSENSGPAREQEVNVGAHCEEQCCRPSVIFRANVPVNAHETEESNHSTPPTPPPPSPITERVGSRSLAGAAEDPAFEAVMIQLSAMFGEDGSNLPVPLMSDAVGESEPLTNEPVNDIPSILQFDDAHGSGTQSISDLDRASVLFDTDRSSSNIEPPFSNRRPDEHGDIESANPIVEPSQHGNTSDFESPDHGESEEPFELRLNSDSEDDIIFVGVYENSSPAHAPEEVIDDKTAVDKIVRQNALEDNETTADANSSESSTDEMENIEIQSDCSKTSNAKTCSEEDLLQLQKTLLCYTQESGPSTRSRSMSVSKKRKAMVSPSAPAPSCIMLHEKASVSSPTQLRTPHGQNSVHFECSICKQNFREKIDFTRHCFTHMKNKLSQVANERVKPVNEKENSFTSTYKCNECKKIFTAKRSLKYHLSRVCCKKYYEQCDHCQAFFSNKSDLEKHCNLYRFSCVICKHHFKTKRAGDKHAASHTNTKCTVCDVVFKQKQHLKQHNMAKHSEERPYKCKQCAFSFKLKYSLKVHILSAHCDDRPYKCGQCHTTFKLKYHLTQHSLVHSDKRSFKCNQCVASFKSHRSLKIHTSSVHSTKRPYKCTECSASFQYKPLLKNHSLAVHPTGDHPFKCHDCDSVFKLKCLLRQHITRRHMDLKLFKCHKCPKSFTTNEYLRKHVLSHSDIKTFSCHVCSSTFKSGNGLWQHKKKHS